MQPDEEEKLINQAKNGDERAITRLYNEHVLAIYRYISYRVGDEATAEDLTSETFLRAFEGLETFEYRGVPYRAWLYRIAYARIGDFHRKQGKRIQKPLDTVTLISDADLEGTVSHILRVEQLAEMLPRLTDSQQEVIILRFIEGYSIAETAQYMDKSDAAVKGLQHRAIRSLARIYENEHGELE